MAVRKSRKALFWSQNKLVSTTRTFSRKPVVEWLRLLRFPPKWRWFTSAHYSDLLLEIGLINFTHQPCSPVHLPVGWDIDLVIGCQYIMHVGLGGVYEHGVWDPDIIRWVFSSHSKSYLGSQVMRQSLVFPVLPKKHVQSEFLKKVFKNTCNRLKW